MTPNIGIIQRTSLFGQFDNAKQPQIYIQYKAWWDLFELNGKIVGPLYDHLGGGGVNI